MENCAFLNSIYGSMNILLGRIANIIKLFKIYFLTLDKEKLIKKIEIL